MEDKARLIAFFVLERSAGNIQMPRSKSNSPIRASRISLFRAPVNISNWVQTRQLNPALLISISRHSFATSRQSGPPIFYLNPT
ncbi:hypothetical protein CXF74_09220 [Psychromonas sp. Urea-02u-13]|nr:hypothetical protein CXF74_09220 [Psychromonas sp. Urea-02u-13]